MEQSAGIVNYPVLTKLTHGIGMDSTQFISSTSIPTNNKFSEAYGRLHLLPTSEQTLTAVKFTNTDLQKHSPKLQTDGEGRDSGWSNF